MTVYLIKDVKKKMGKLKVNQKNKMTQPSFNALMLTIETLEEGVKYVQC